MKKGGMMLFSDRLPLARLAALVVLVAVAGCAKVGPDFRPPEPPAPTAWLEAEADRARSDLPVNREWWRVFGDDSLDRLVAAAYEGNPSLRVAGLRVLEARATLGVAVGYLYPQNQQANASLAFARTSERAASAPQGGAPTSSFQAWQDSVSLSAAWELDFWGKYRRAVEAAESELQASVADYDSGLVSLTANVANAYVLIRTYDRRLAIARENLDLQQEGLKIAQVRFQNGVVSERDVHQALTLLRNTEAGISDLEASLRQARHSLSLLLGQAPGDLGGFLTGSAAIPVAPRQAAVGVPADLARRRPDIRAAEFQAAAECARVGVAQARLYPSFSLTGSVGFLSTDAGRFNLADIASARAFTASVGPSAVLPLFNYGQLANEVRAQDARFQQALENYRYVTLAALRETEDALAAFQRSQDRAEALTASEQAARRSAELAFVQYREGQTDFTTVLVAQQNLLSVQDSLAVAQGNIALNLVGLYKALGGGWEIREGRPFVPQDDAAAMAERVNWGGLLEENPERLVEPARQEDRLKPDW